MSVICPTILAEEPHGYRIQLKRVLPFADRVHLDFMDGIFASPKSITLSEAFWPIGLKADLHIMYQDPEKHLRTILAMRPYLVVVHAEAAGNFGVMADALHERKIGVGVALLPETPVSSIAPALPIIDHVLVFSGKLGHFGGVADTKLFNKVYELRDRKPDLEIGWDGGINASNVTDIASAGVDVLNVGGFIQHATDPEQAYATLESLT